MPIVLAVVVVVALAIVAPRLIAQQRRAEKSAECRHLQRRIAGARVQGGDAQEVARLEADLRLCVADAQAAGEDIDTSLVTIESARAIANHIAGEWAHYKTTTYDDSVKRNNTRSRILSLGEELVRTLRLAASQATSLTSIDAVRDFAIETARASFDRGMCYDSGATGCGRFALSEPDWDERELDEWVQIMLPIIGVHADVPTETQALWLRVRPRWEVLGVGPATWAPRLGNHIYADRIPKIREAGAAPLLDDIAARRRELAPDFKFHAGIASRTRLQLGRTLFAAR